LQRIGEAALAFGLRQADDSRAIGKLRRQARNSETTLDALVGVEQPPQSLQTVEAFHGVEVGMLAPSSVTAGTKTVSDGLGCWQALAMADCDRL
jgi:hypothetical protein